MKPLEPSRVVGPLSTLLCPRCDATIVCCFSDGRGDEGSAHCENNPAETRCLSANQPTCTWTGRVRRAEGETYLLLEKDGGLAIPRTTYFLAYWPLLDSVDNGGFLLEVEDFRPGRYAEEGVEIDLAKEDALMRAATRHLPTTPPLDFEETRPPSYQDAILLPIQTEGPHGFTYAELRRAANRYRAEHGLGCYHNPDPKTPETPLCGAPADINGRCPVHA